MMSALSLKVSEFLSNSGIQLLGQSKDQIDRWYEKRDSAPYPVLNPTQENTYPSTRFLQDGSYIRLNTLTLTYNFPAQLASGMGLRYFNMYIGGQNLLTFSKYDGYDPDVGYVDPAGGSIGANISRGIDFFSTPQARTYTVGIRVGF